MHPENRFTALMREHLRVVVPGPENSMCLCPFCGGRQSLSFNDVKGLWLCFKCGEKGTAETLVKKLGGTYRDPEYSLALLSDQLRLLDADVPDVRRCLPESYLQRFHLPGRVYRYWRERGFGADVCQRWELGMDALSGRYTLPFRDPFSGRLGGVIFRLPPGEPGPRYQYPRGFDRRNSLYGSWHLVPTQSRTVSLVEGPTDCISVDRAGVPVAAQYGSSLSGGQVHLLHRLGIASVVLFYDYDWAGIKATRTAQQALADFQVRKVSWDTEKYCWHRLVCRCRFKHTAGQLGQCTVVKKCSCGRIHEPDPGSLGMEEILDMEERAIPL
jgi:Toprim-like